MLHAPAGTGKYAFLKTLNKETTTRTVKSMVVTTS